MESLGGPSWSVWWGQRVDKQQLIRTSSFYVDKICSGFGVCVKILQGLNGNEEED